MTLDTDTVLEVIRHHVTETVTLHAIAKELLATAKQEKEAAVKEPRGKTRLVALIRGDEALKFLVAGGAFTVAVPDGDDDPTTTTYHGDALVERLRKAAIAHNEAPAKRRGKRAAKIETWQQAFSILKAKTIKGSGSQISIRGKGNPIEVVVLTKETIS